MAVERQGKVTTFDNGVRYAINRYVDVNREYDNVSGAKKKAILDEYSEAKQRNIMMAAILLIADSLDIAGDEITELKKLQEFITKA